MDHPSSQIYLVTGGAGFIGSSFVEMLKQRGDRVIVLDALTYAGHECNLEGFEGPGTVRLVQGDIGDGDLVARLLHEYEPQFVVNFAAESHVDRSISGPSLFIETNVVGTFQMLNQSRLYWESLKQKNSPQAEVFRYLQVSTDEVFGSLGETGFFSETTPYQPNSPYSASKAGADHLVRAWNHTYGLPTLVTNCSNNYGPRQFPEKLIPLMIHQALNGHHLPIYGNGQNVRDWIHVEDHCRGIWLALHRGKVGETYCFGGNAERRNMQVVDLICEILSDLRPRAGSASYSDLKKFVTDRAGHDWRYAIDSSKAEKELGFERKYTFEAGLRQTIEWYLQNNEWRERVLARSSVEQLKAQGVNS